MSRHESHLPCRHPPASGSCESAASEAAIFADGQHMSVSVERYAPSPSPFQKLRAMIPHR